MKYLMTFNENTTSNKYGIGDWIEDLKNFEWGRKSIDYNSIKKWSDHFIGEGWCDKIMTKINKMFLALSKVDIDYIEMRMFDVYDELPSEKEKWVMCCIAYGDADRFDKPTKYKYNGLVTVPNKDERDKLRILVHILKEIVFPTLYIGSYPNYYLRQSDESYYVTEPKWQCQNFNIDDYKELGVEVGASFDVDDHRDRKTTIYQSDIDKKKRYSINKIIEMYVPCITIEIGSRENYLKGPMNLVKLESLLDETLESILPTLDYQEVIFDMGRGDRMFDQNMEIYDYTLRIILNF